MPPRCNVHALAPLVLQRCSHCTQHTLRTQKSSSPPRTTGGTGAQGCSPLPRGRTLPPPHRPRPHRQGRLSGVPRTLTHALPSPPCPPPGSRTPAPHPARPAGDARSAPPPHPGGAGGPGPGNPPGQRGSHPREEALLARRPPHPTGWARASPGRGCGDGATAAGGVKGGRAGPARLPGRRLGLRPRTAPTTRGREAGRRRGAAAGVPLWGGRRGQGVAAVPGGRAAAARVATHSRQAADRAPPS